MILAEIIAVFERAIRLHGDRVIRWGFDPATAHSWRGKYWELSFEPAENVLASAMLAGLKSALGKTFEGYKGGEYQMCEYTEVYIDRHGTSDGNRISGQLLNYWFPELPEQPMSDGWDVQDKDGDRASAYFTQFKNWTGD